MIFTPLVQPSGHIQLQAFAPVLTNAQTSAATAGSNTVDLPVPASDVQVAAAKSAVGTASVHPAGLAAFVTSAHLNFVAALTTTFATAVAVPVQIALGHIFTVVWAKVAPMRAEVRVSLSMIVIV